MKKYKILFWDLDGTLTDSLPGIAKGLDILFAHYAMDIDKSSYRTFVGPPLRTSFARHFKVGQEIDEALEVFRRYYNDKGIFDATCYSGIKETLSTLKERGYRMFVATSKREDVAIQVVESFGISKYFERVFGAIPEQDIVEKEDVLENVFKCYSELDKSQCLMIGDTIYDARGAKIVGIDYLGAMYGFGERKDIMDYKPVAIIETPLELLELLSGNS